MLTETVSAQRPVAETLFKWSRLADLPDEHGFAGAFAGLSHQSLIFAGGANFPDGGAPWTGAKKVWTNCIYVLNKPEGRWQEAGKLPQPMGYGVSVSWKDELICAGGSNADGHSRKVIGLIYINGHIKVNRYPDLPAPLANSSGILIGSKLYIAGGLLHQADTTAGSNFWVLDLALPGAQQHWQVLPSWPGPPRMLSVAATDGECFYLFSGAALQADGPAGIAKRRYLTDAYRYHPQKGWAKLADMPAATVAAPGALYNNRHSKHELLIFGGDDGQLATKAAELQDRHPGFSNLIRRYNIETNSWSIAGYMPLQKKADAAQAPNRSIWPPVTTSLVHWRRRLVFAGGEVRPAVRTPHVLIAAPLF